MRLSVETITPEIAEEYLRRNTANRGIKKSLVLQYARDMKNGSWKLTHQGIAFSADGTLLDGQHRLHAIVESGSTVQMMVVRDVDSRNQLFMDDHAKRTAGDALTLSRGEHVTTTDVAVIRAAIELQNLGNVKYKTKSELNDLVDHFRGALDFIAPYVSTKERGVTSAPVWGAIAMAWFYVDDLERLNSFCRVLCGLDMASEEGDRSAQSLREWLLRTGVRYGSIRIEAFKKTQRAIVAFMKYQKIDKLYGTSIHYPWPLIDPVRTSGSAK